MFVIQFGIKRRARSPASAASRICGKIKASMTKQEKQAWLWSLAGICAHLPPPRNDLHPTQRWVLLFAV